MQKFWITNKASNDTAEIFLYGYIDPFDVSAGDFVKELRQLENNYANINIRINSGGGSVFEGLAIYNALQVSKANVETYIDGLAASMASVIACAGKKCHMSDSAMIMTHKPTVGSWGTADEHKKNAALLETLEATLAAIYATKTGKTAEDCKTTFMHGQDQWFSADEAKAAGLVDAIFNNPAIKAPTEKGDAKNVWSLYNTQQFAAVFNNQKTNTDMIKLTTAAMAALSLTENFNEVELSAAVINLQNKVTQAEQAKTTAETALSNLKAEYAKAEVAAIAKVGLDAGKYSKEVHDKLVADYATNPTGLKDLVDGMRPYKPITSGIAVAAASGEQKDLADKSWDELDKIDGALDNLKAGNIDLFKEKYKAKFQKEYAG